MQTYYTDKTTQISAWGLVPFIKNLGDKLTGCEIGVKEGINLRYFLDQIPNIEKVYAIDPWLSYDPGKDWGIITQIEVDGWKNKAFDLLADYSHKVNVLELSSIDAVAHIPDNSLDYIFIDGDHSYQAVSTDVRNYWSKVKTGGIFAGHDWNWTNEVQKTVNEFRNEYNIITEIQFTDSQVWFWIKQ